VNLKPHAYKRSEGHANFSPGRVPLPEARVRVRGWPA